MERLEMFQLCEVELKTIISAIGYKKSVFFTLKNTVLN